MIRVAVVNMARFHLDAASGLFVDDAKLASGKLAPGTTLSADVAAYTLLSLRTARRALDSQLTLYANTSPDTQGIPSPLDSFSKVDGVTFAARLDALITTLSNAFYDKLTTAAGVAYAGWDVAGGKSTDGGTSLDAHSAAVRGLLVAYLATGQTKFRDRAAQVFARLDGTFYDAAARIYRPTAGDTSLTVTFTPRRFGLLQGALRDSYELIATLPGQDGLAAQVLDRVGRLDKLVLNGWDDRNQNQLVDWPGECAQLGTGPDGQPMGQGGPADGRADALGRDRLARAVHAGRRRSRHHHRSRARLCARDLGGQAPRGARQLRDVHAHPALTHPGIPGTGCEF